MNSLSWAILAFAISALGTWMHILLARNKLSLNAAPREDRWHKKITPSMGGVSFVFSTIVVCLLAGLHTAIAWKFLAVSALMAILGLLDDLFRFKPYIKLAGQIILSCTAAYLGIHMLITFNPIIFIPLTIFWIVGITNAFNLLDNMDGLSAGTAVISIIFLCLYQNLFEILGPIPWIIVGSVMGFLIFNWNPAKIFMGDCGSHWLGFVVSALAIFGTWQGASSLIVILLSPILILMVPIFDTLLVSIQRKIHGLPISMGGKDHSSHRLVALGLSEKKTVLTLWLLSAVCGTIVLLGRILDVPTLSLAICGILLVTLIFGLLLSDVKIYSVEKPDTAIEKKILPTNLFFKRRMLDVLIDTLLIGSAYTLSYLLRYDWKLDAFLRGQLQSTVLFTLAVKLFVFIIMGLYEGFWVYLNFKSVIKILKACLVATTATVLLVLVLFRFSGFSRTLFAIDMVLLFLMMIGARGFMRWVRETFVHFPHDGMRLGLIGTSNTADYIVKEIQKHPEWKLNCIGAIQINPEAPVEKSLTILGNLTDLSKAIQANKLHRLMLTETVPASVENELRHICETSGISIIIMEPLGHSLLKNLAR